MKCRKSSVKKLAGDILLLGAFVLTKNCMEKLENKMREENKDDESINRKLSLITVVYHALEYFIMNRKE